MESTKRPLEEEEASEERTHAGCTAQKYSLFCRCKPMVQWRQTRALMLALRNVDQYFPWTLDSTIFENKPGIPSLHAALGLSLLDLSY